MQSYEIPVKEKKKGKKLFGFAHKILYSQKINRSRSPAGQDIKDHNLGFFTKPGQPEEEDPALTLAVASELEQREFKNYRAHYCSSLIYILIQYFSPIVVFLGNQSSYKHT